ncbi:MAG: phosphate ABC transporter substrate-binding protein PstS [Microthrixaceae bacterium]
MNPRRAGSRRISALMFALPAILGHVATACGEQSQASGSSTSAVTSGAQGGAEATPSTADPDVDYKSLSGTLNGTGSSFQDALQQTVKGPFEKAAENVTVNYAKSGSSAGKADLAAGIVQFAGTDSLIKDADLPTFKGGEVLYFPVAAAPITLSYHLEGVDELRLSADTIAGIFQSTITTWNAPEIKADNPDANLPATPIAAVHRSDGSGTTSNFTKYLKKAAPSVWTLGAGDTVNWPAGTQGAEKNSGVATLISSTEGAVGYVDLADSVSAKLQRALVRNKAGEYVTPQIPGASAALAGAGIAPNLTYDPLDAEGAESYPITSPTWVIVYKQQPDAATADALKGYLTYLLTDGQKLAPKVGYAPLPAELQRKAIEQLARVTG